VSDDHRRPLVAFEIVTNASSVLVLSTARGQAQVAAAQAHAVRTVSGILPDHDTTTPRAGTPSAASAAVERDDEPEVEPASPSTGTREHASRGHRLALGHAKVHGHGKALGHDKVHGHDEALGHDKVQAPARARGHLHAPGRVPRPAHRQP
jgi:hypothetical protein